MTHLKPTDFNATKHSDYFVWQDTSERVARRCDDTVDQKRVKSCVLYKESWTTKIIVKKTQKYFLRRATHVTFSKFRGWLFSSLPRWSACTPSFSILYCLSLACMCGLRLILCPLSELVCDPLPDCYFMVCQRCIARRVSQSQSWWALLSGH